ncbi:MAG: GntR family transcriptional regulator [Plesiomonas sp.]
MQTVSIESLFDTLKAQLDSQNNTPLYLALAQGIRQAIEDKQLKNGQVLPSERSLAEQLALSRATVVKALALLAEQGLVFKQQGKGSVVHAPFSYNLTGGSFTAQLGMHGELSDRWLVRELISVTPALAQMMTMSVGDEVAKIRRVRCVDGQPMSVETTYIPKTFLPRPDLLEGSLYAAWQQAGIQPYSQQYQIRQITPSAADAALLALKEGTTVLEVTQRSYTAAMALLEVSQSLCRADYYSFTVTTRIESACTKSA